MIPFNRVSIIGNELDHINRAISTGYICGDHEFTKRTQKLLESELGAQKVLLTTSCTHALEMAALLLDIKPGDEVIVPSYTFVSTANAFALRGAKIVFADIREDTLNINEELLPTLITSRTRAIVVVHYAGVGCNMDAIMAVAKKHNIPVVEDNAHGLFGKYKGKWLGTFGAMATLSFHETKNFTCGEGGALIINDPKYAERAEIIREKGTNRSKFFRGQVDKYTWVDIGSSYLMSELQAAFLLGQLERWRDIQDRRKEIWLKYDLGFRQSIPIQTSVRFPYVPSECDQAYHMYYLILKDLKSRTAFIRKMKDKNIMTVFHYLPLHLSPMGISMGGQNSLCPVTESISDRLVRLPFYFALNEEDQDKIIRCALESING